MILKVNSAPPVWEADIAWRTPEHYRCDQVPIGENPACGRKYNLEADLWYCNLKGCPLEPVS